MLIISASYLMAQDCNASFYVESDPECINCFYFTNTSQTNLNSDIQFEWDMGDGTNYYTENVHHQFSSSNTFNVNLNIQVPICTGILQISADGGVAPYEFQWSNGYSETSDSLSIQDSLCPGNYYITITDAINNNLIQNIILEDMTGLELNIDIDYINCSSEFPDSCIGELTAIPSGGTPPYTYQWSTGSTESTIENLCPGTYEISICDANDLCESKIIRLPIFECGITSFTSPISSDSCNGIIDFSANGGSFPYLFNWSEPTNHYDNFSTTTAIDLCEGWYTIQATDANGEVCEDKIEIGPLKTEIIIIDTISAGNCNSTIEAVPLLGTPPYTYNWSNGSSEQSINNICEGWYYLTVCDSNEQCTYDSIEINIPPLHNNLNWRGPSQINACDGYIYVNTEGGYPPYSYSWEPTVNSLDGYDFTLINDLCDATYILTTCDSYNNCITDTIEISDKPFNLSLNYTNPANSECNGKIHCEAFGASAPYNFLWSTGDEFLYQTECYLHSLCPGTYYVTVCDFENNCVVDSVTLLELPSGPEIININYNLSSTEESCNASALIEAIGQEPLEFFWSCESWNDENISGIENQCPGVYYVTICDNNNICTTDSLELINLTGHFSFIQNPFNLNCNGKLVYEAHGGYPPYTYNWSNGQNSNQTNELCPGWYYITITDHFNNSIIDSIEITNLSISPLEAGHENTQSSTIMNYCTENSTQQIHTDFFTSLKGHVYFGNSLLPEGVVIFFSQENDSIKAEKVCKIENGNYRIEQLQKPYYYVLAIPIFSPEIEYFPIYFPTYYGDIMNWADAYKIFLYDSLPKDIHLNKSELVHHGKHKIKGQLLYDENSNFEENIFLSNWYYFDSPGIPQAGMARHIPVYLISEQGELLKYQLTNHEGRFQFNHLKEGNYSLHFEKPGYTSHYHLHHTSDSLSEITYIITKSDIDLFTTDISSSSTENDINLYPNPAKNHLNINLSDGTNPYRQRISIYNSCGELLFEKRMTSQHEIINLQNIPKGLLIIKISNNSIVKTMKIIHE